jgi:Toluene-4-monooxygenase system protein B (TmoB)
VLVPLYGFLQGDTLGLVVLVHDHQRVRDIASVLQQAATCRVAPRGKVDVLFRGQRLEPDATIAQVGLSPLDRVDVVGVGGEPCG